MLFCNILTAQSNIDYKVSSEKEWSNILKKAKYEKKEILLYISGSDWCGKCHLLKKRVIDKKDFKEFIQKHWIFVNIDFPQAMSHISKAEQKVKERLAEKFNREGVFPRLVLIDFNSNGLSDIKGYKGQPLVEIIDKLKNDK